MRGCVIIVSLSRISPLSYRTLSRVTVQSCCDVGFRGGTCCDTVSIIYDCRAKLMFLPIHFVAVSFYYVDRTTIATSSSCYYSLRLIKSAHQLMIVVQPLLLAALDPAGWSATTAAAVQCCFAAPQPRRLVVAAVAPAAPAASCLASLLDCDSITVRAPLGCC